MSIKTFYSDEELIYLAQHGNQEAYNQLFLRYYRKVQQIIYFHINDPAHVHDLAQEVLLKVYRYLRYFKEKSQFSTWLYRITQNTIKNYYRKMSLRMSFETELFENQIPAIQESPEYFLTHLELSEQLELAMSTLSEELRLCYTMYLLDEQTYEHIAEKMHCPIGTVRSRIFRARKLLMAALALYPPKNLC